MLTSTELDGEKFKHTVMDVNLFTHFKNIQFTTKKNLPNKIGNVQLMAKIEDRANPKKYVEREVLPADRFAGNDKEIFERIMTVVLELGDITLEQIKSRRRTNQIITPRKIAIYLTRLLTDFSLNETAKLFHRDHATVLHSQVTMFNSVSMKDKKIFTIYREVLQRLKDNYNIIPTYEKSWYENLVAGVPSRFLPKKFNTTQVNEMKELSNNISSVAIGKMFGCDGKTVARIILNSHIKNSS